MSAVFTLPDRAHLSPPEFRQRLRTLLLQNPQITLQHVANHLNISKQRVALMVGRLDRPTCARPNRPSPKRDEATKRLPELNRLVAEGHTAEKAAKQLGLSLFQAMAAGFRARSLRPSHGTTQKFKAGCSCWRCRRAAGIVLPRGPKNAARKKESVLDWCAWVDPDENDRGLTQVEIAKLAGVSQGAVSRIARAAE